ncbi:MAG: 4-hydroxy-3-methylbut-2-enyl diphosphate reductase [Solobacterium sp.]|nr:4-hydroxy-3-methylbut-2-enyl diphosphate reductase [Solobacterium sp.]
MEIIKVSPRGYCRGVIQAIQIAKQTIKDYPDMPVYMLGMIVHNQYIVQEFQKAGVICLEDNHCSRLELLDQIDHGVVIFTAHGVSDAVYQKAEAKGLIIVDATCRDVKTTHDIVREHCKSHDVIYIGKHNHPEAEGVVGLSNRVYLVSSVEEASSLPALDHPLITCQTTLSMMDTEKLIQYCLSLYPDAVLMNEICNATTIRQKAVLELKNVDVLIVVGDPHSNNSNQLKKCGQDAGIPRSYLIEHALELKQEMFKKTDRIAVTSGSSTPSVLTEQVISVLNQYAETGQFILPDALPSSMF